MEARTESRPLTEARDLTPIPAQPVDTDPTRLKRDLGWTCGLCHTRFRRWSARHVARHGYTTAHYWRVFGGPAARLPDGTPPADAVSLTDPSAQAITAASKLILEQKFIAEVGEAMLNGPMRDRLAYSLATLLETRAHLHGKNVARLEAINQELSQDWRVKQGGENGAPTETKDLLFMHSAALTELRSSEELFTKTAKLAIEEAKGRKDHGLIPEGLDRYTGEAEKIKVPTNLSSADREAVRTLFVKLSKGLEARRRASGEVAGVVVQPTTAAITLPIPTLPAPPPADVTATPIREVDEPF